MKSKSFSGRLSSLFEDDEQDTVVPESPPGEGGPDWSGISRDWESGESSLVPQESANRQPSSRVQRFILYFIEPETETETKQAVPSPVPAAGKPEKTPAVPVGRRVRIRLASLRTLGSKILVFFIEPAPEVPEEAVPVGISNGSALPQELAVIPPPEPEPVPATADAGSIAVAEPPRPSFMQKIRTAFAAPVQKEILTLDFNPGVLDTPSLDGSLRDVNITYPIDPPYQYVHIEYSKKDGALIYEVVEPQLSEDEKVALDIVERAFEKLVSTNLEVIEGDQRIEYLRERFYSLVNIFGLKLTEQQKERMFFTLKKQYLGYSRIDTLMKDRYIEDISCNGSDIYLYVQHRIYGSTRTNVKFGEVELNNFVLKLAQIGGRHISLLQPIRDVSLPDGSRGNLTLGGEVTKKGSTFTIRKFRANPISPIEMMDYHSVDAMELAYMWILMEYKRSILVSGGTATGKTTFLNVLCSFIPPEYKIVSIEDTAELNLMHPNWIQSITRAGFGSSSGGESVSGVSGVSSKSPGDISLYDLLVAALRQRPEFIIVGEVRGSEAFTLFQAIAVGHAALGTIHAGSMDELLARVESNPMNVPRSLFSNLDVVLFPMHIKKGERSMRRLANIVEMLELDRDTGDLITNTSFKWLPDVDEFQYQGRSFLFDKIRDTHGVSKDLLNQELEDRTDFLLGLQRAGIRDYDAVTEQIRAYYRDKPAVMKQIVSVQTDDMEE
ncbi:type II secretion system protein E [Methanoregula boonei 6A8]|jgi:flagellar protein FlaI|uniref:Type II secretion system protein E n=1 Tax=Methanoregula boonei (strain DSM 21154 / JCM 14090 / 6A8) TaxID=456442 RepID=A7IB25_METB6|nr:type II/IV secretion system ATPase subunit [Methanoregula boonei]ABS56936.1 type II secretion system protein E [Methanoregula boonei 6A8]